MYSAAVAAFLNANKDRIVKRWCDVVKFFFVMNEDKCMVMLAEVAAAFENVRHPNVFRIDASDIELYLRPIKLTAADLKVRGYKIDVDFIDDDAGLRLTFPTLRALIFASGNKRLLDGYELIDAMYQLYVRYEVAMASRIKIPTHWTLVERIDEFTQVMQPHIQRIRSEKSQAPRAASAKFLTMNEQPRVFMIVKGTSKALNDRFTKQANSTAPRPKFSSQKAIPIFESTLPDVRDEIEAVLNYLKQRHELPYRQSQLGQLGAEDMPISKLQLTKCSIKTSKTMILIDPSQSVYTPDMLSGHIQDIREMLRRGIVGSRTWPAPEGSVNTTNLDIFKRTRGRFMDTFLAVELHPTTEIPYSLREPVAPIALPVPQITPTMAASPAIPAVLVAPAEVEPVEVEPVDQVKPTLGETSDTSDAGNSSDASDVSENNYEDIYEPRLTGRTRSSRVKVRTPFIRSGRSPN